MSVDNLLPYNRKLKTRATEMRRAGNLAEVVLWKHLSRSRLNNLKFNRQRIIGNYIVDFFCAELNLVIEVDGSFHDDRHEYDSERDAFLSGLGLRVIRIPADDVLHNINAVIQTLKEKLLPKPLP